MRPLIFSVMASLALANAGGAGSAPPPSGNSGGVSQLPVGQVYREFQFPYYENGQLRFILTAAQATGVTINRAETTDLKIDLYENGKITTTITSPKADLFVADRTMRTHNTVKIDRADLTATAQFCDFDLVSKQYTLRNNVKVLLKNFEAKNKSKPAAPRTAASATAPDISSTPPMPAAVPAGSASDKIDALLESPGMYSSTNSAPAH